MIWGVSRSSGGHPAGVLAPHGLNAQRMTEEPLGDHFWVVMRISYMTDLFQSPGDAGHGSFGFSNHVNASAIPSKGRGRVRGDDFGLPDRETLVDLAATYLDVQARLWPELVGTPAVPVSIPATVQPMADAYDRRFRGQAADVFRHGAYPKLWMALGIAYLRFSDEGSNPQSLAQQLINVLTRARWEGVFVPWEYVLADVNARLAELARQPIPSTKKLEQEIANEDRQLKRLTDRLDKIDGTHLDAVIAKAEEMGRQLAAKRERLKDLQRMGRRPKVKSVREQDVVALLSNLRDLLQGDVGMAAQVLKALVGDVSSRPVRSRARRARRWSPGLRSTPCRRWRCWAATRTRRPRGMMPRRRCGSRSMALWADVWRRSRAACV